MQGFGTLDRVQGYALVQGYQSAAVFDRECQQIRIGELTWAKQLVCIDEGFVQKADVVRPEDVVLCIGEMTQTLDQVLQRRVVGVAALTHDA